MVVLYWCACVCIMCVLCRGGTALENVLPLSSRYLMSSTSASVSCTQQKPDVATLAAENRALHETVEQQHFKLKVCLYFDLISAMYLIHGILYALPSVYFTRCILLCTVNFWIF